MIEPRGIRLNNPGNIRHGNKDAWEGMTAVQSDPDFITFVDPVYGLRAIGRILITYMEKDSLYSVAEMIARWAPPSENNTAAYVAAVAAQMHVDPLAPLDLSPDMLADFIAAIVQHENGQQPYPQDLINRAVAMALSQE